MNNLCIYLFSASKIDQEYATLSIHFWADAASKMSLLLMQKISFEAKYEKNNENRNAPDYMA